jgi:hypothetical protein
MISAANLGQEYLLINQDKNQNKNNDQYTDINEQ